MRMLINKLRLFLCFFSGEDDFIIRKCNKGIQLAFASIGLFVLVIFTGCLFSASLFMSHVFEGAQWLGFFIGFIWAMLVTNLYLLLLYTVSPALLPIARRRKVKKEGNIRKMVIEEKEKARHPLLQLSLLFRMGLIILIATIIMQPFNVLLFSPLFDDAHRYVYEMKTILSKHPVAWITTVLGCIIFLLPIYFKYRIRAISRKNFNTDFAGEQSGSGVLYLREQLGNPVDFEKLSKKILSTDIKEIKTSDFYFQKTLIEYRIILEEYEKFKDNFSGLLMEKNREYNRKSWNHLMPYLNKLEKINPGKHKVLYDQLLHDMQEEQIQHYEYWADPPFRTILKTPKAYVNSEAQLIQSFYEGTN